jgi:hypothetical protein
MSLDKILKKYEKAVYRIIKRLIEKEKYEEAFILGNLPQFEEGYRDYEKIQKDISSNHTNLIARYPSYDAINDYNEFKEIYLSNGIYKIIKVNPTFTYLNEKYLMN